MPDIEYIGNSDDGNSITWVVDPNSYGKNAVPNENLFVWVNFRALPRTRSIIESDGTYSSEFFDENGINFITSTTQNGEGYKTTNYTNIGGTNTGEEEAFNIESISMEYGAKMVPQCKIKFVDVRGAGLFNGYEMEDDKGMKYNSSQFATFFKLPYPIFQLSVKGYYGNAVSYCLHLRKWSASFDAESGNFIIDADFIGYTYAFLSDIIMKYVMSITSSELGETALEKQNTALKAKRENAKDIIPFNDFLGNLGKITEISKDFKDNSTEYEELKLINSIEVQLKKIQQAVGKPVNENNANIYGATLPFPQLRVNRDQLFIRDVGLISESSESTHDIIISDLRKFIEEYNKELIDENVTNYPYLTSYKINQFNLKTPDLAWNINDTTNRLIVNEVLKDGITNNANLIKASAIRSRLGINEGSDKKFYIVNYHDIREEVSDLLKEIEQKKTEQQQLVNEKLNETLNKSLGFDLSIETVMTIVLGNVEAFLDVVYQFALRADDPNIQNNRIEGLNNIRSDINPKDQRIYPFPAVYDSTTGDEIWIGEIVGEDNSSFPEIELVRTIINGVVSSNGKKSKNRNKNFQKKNVTGQNSGWVAISPNDISNNFNRTENFPFTGNIVPQELAETILDRAFIAHQKSLYNSNKAFSSFAKLEGGYSYSTIQNSVVKNTISSYNTTDFVNQVYEISGDAIVNKVSNPTDGFSILDVTEDTSKFSTIYAQPRRIYGNIITDIIKETNSSLEDILIPKGVKSLHRKLNSYGGYVSGFIEDSMWKKDVFNTINKAYKAKTSETLEQDKPITSTLPSIITDLTVFDGQINPTIDYTKPNNVDKYQNNAHKYINKNNITPNIEGEILTSTKIYNVCNDYEKGLLYLLTLPIENADIFGEVAKVAGTYSMLRIQLVWLGAQFYRKSIADTGTTIFEDIRKNRGLDLQYGQPLYQQVENRLLIYAGETEGLLPKLDYTDDFKSKLIEYFKSWVDNEYISTEEETSVEDFISYIASWEDFYNYKPYGFTLGNTGAEYGYSGTTQFNQIDLDEAVDLYKNTYYKNVEILPYFLQPMALDIHINQGDHMGMIVATAERMGANMVYNFKDVRDVWFGEGIYVGDAQKNIGDFSNYKSTYLYNYYLTEKATIDLLFEQDPQLFLEELTKTRLMYYSRTPGRNSTGSLSGNILYQEWSWRSLGMLQYNIDFILNTNHPNSFYYTNVSQFEKKGVSLSLELNNAANSIDSPSWYSKVRQIASKYLTYDDTSVVINTTKLENSVKAYLQYKDYKNEDPFEATYQYREYQETYYKILDSLLKNTSILITDPRSIFNTTESLEKVGYIQLTEDVLRAYIASWHKKFIKLNSKNARNNNALLPNETTTTEKQSFYVEDNDFKLSVYRHLKTLYDKWLGGSNSEQIHNSCSYSAGKPRSSQLIDRFHFIDRAWSYIGNKAIIDHKAILTLLNSADINLYSYIGRIMQASKFSFHVMPSWVNYKDINDIAQMWEPQTNLENVSVGAAYLCMYMGGKSKSLDIGKNQAYVNDGFDLREYDKSNVPDGFSKRRTPYYLNELEDNEKFKYNMCVFRVGYADQNQSIFNQISVSQEEHRETAESMIALSDNIDNRGGTKRFYKGTNLYNVFSTRSYDCTVSCLGNLQIHPLNYFQLDNVPFFHGAYLIKKVSHEITANHITTSFTGSRVPRYTVPIIENATSYINIPLNDTLKNTGLSENVVRPLQDEEKFASNGEDDLPEIGEVIAPPTTQEFAEAEESGNSPFTVNLANTNQQFTFFIQPNVTQESFEQQYNAIFNSNTKNTYGLKLGNCQGWIKESLRKLGVLQSSYYGLDAWTFFSGLDDTNMVFINDADFSNNLNGGWSNQSLADAGIPDGSFIHCYYPATEYTYRSIDRMISTGISEHKVNNLKRLKVLDTKKNNFNENGFFTYVDNTPISKQKFSLNGYKTRWDGNQISNYAKQINGQPLPFAPVTHTAIYANGGCYHLGRTIYDTPTPSMRIVAYYPFKNKILSKL